jgi:hypothetical protein
MLQTVPKAFSQPLCDVSGCTCLRCPLQSFLLSVHWFGVFVGPCFPVCLPSCVHSVIVSRCCKGLFLSFLEYGTLCECFPGLILFVPVDSSREPMWWYESCLWGGKCGVALGCRCFFSFSFAHRALASSLALLSMIACVYLCGQPVAGPNEKRKTNQIHPLAVLSWLWRTSWAVMRAVLLLVCVAAGAALASADCSGAPNNNPVYTGKADQRSARPTGT